MLLHSQEMCTRFALTPHTLPQTQINYWTVKISVCPDLIIYAIPVYKICIKLQLNFLSANHKFNLMWLHLNLWLN